MPAPQEIVELVDQFSRRISEYRGSLYNETELRNEFVNPFFAALGWDMDNRQGLSGDLKEVKVEESIRVEESIKNPDYSFRLGRSRKFFVEAKKPSINIEGGVYPAFQLRRYAWSASLKLSILTDFEEFAVYDCRDEPKKIDRPGKGRLLYLQYDQYVERWDEIAALFSKQAVLAGSLERFIEAIPEKRGNKRVDAALLDEISGWMRPWRWRRTGGGDKEQVGLTLIAIGGNNHTNAPEVIRAWGDGLCAISCVWRRRTSVKGYTGSRSCLRGFNLRFF